MTDILESKKYKYILSIKLACQYFVSHIPSFSMRCSPTPPVPCPNLYVQLNALQLVLDPRSLEWLNLFGLDLRQSLEQFMEIYKLNDSQKPEEHVDIKVDGLMLKVGSNADSYCSFEDWSMKEHI